MCCFSGVIEKVADTRIFARASTGGRQYLVYSMSVDAPSAVAMILPIPVARGSGEGAVRFIDLSGYAEFFRELRDAFPQPPISRTPGVPAAAPQTLAVVQVGSFIASYVPSVADFNRVDARFRLPADVWERLPMYADYGFAVFQLKAGRQKVHPMAFEFPRANPAELFFPTVHIHDGEVHPNAEFDHALYCQLETGDAPRGWAPSEGTLGERMRRMERAQGVLDASRPAFRIRLKGMMENRDVVVPAA